MLFNSPEFLLFFIVIYSLYLILPHKAQNRMLLAASCFFYGSWDWRFLLLLIFTAAVDYLMAAGIQRAQSFFLKKVCVAVTVTVDFGILGFFKYFNFFEDSFRNLMEIWFGWSPGVFMVHVILPIGISFYTFQSMCYVTDVYYGRIQPVRKFPDFLLFVTFFPQLVAGPIERAQHMIPQFLNPRIVTRQGILDGLGLVTWGLFKKMVIADSVAPISDRVFGTAHPVSIQVLVGVYAFALQIYGDFSGYSDIARGLGKMMGFDIMVNFRLPYFVTNPRDFWRNWHISLSEWLRDNLYIPLGGSRKGEKREYLNLLITMLLGGLWHGANWTFVLWGAYHGFLLTLERLLRPFFLRVNTEFKPIVLPWKVLKVVGMFHLTCLGWLFFRAHSAAHILELLRGLIHFGGFIPNDLGMDRLIFYAALFAVAWTLKKIPTFLKEGYAQEVAGSFSTGILIYFIISHGVVSKSFIYFQF